MEDVFELLRQRSGGLPPDAIDVLSACLDALETAVEQIAAGASASGSTPRRSSSGCGALARERTPAQELARDGGAALPDLTRGRMVAGESLLHVVAELAEECQMPAVRAFMLFEALRAHGELVGGVPAPDMVERFAGRRVEAWVATRARTSRRLEESARAVGELADVRVREEPVPGARPPPSATQPADAGAASRRRVRPPRAGATVRVDAERLDELLHLMGELVQHRTTVEALAAEARRSPASRRPCSGSRAPRRRCRRRSRACGWSPSSRSSCASRALVRDLAARLGKQVELRLEGADTELDRTVVDALGDPLVHLVRNALDHGLETPAERVAAGKPPTGVLELSARHAGGHVIVVGARRRPRDRPGRRRPRGASSAACSTRTPPPRSTRRAPPSCCSRPASRPRRRRPTCPAAASAWTRCATACARSAARSRSRSRAGPGHAARSCASRSRSPRSPRCS